MNLTEQPVLAITGAAGGIGSAIARRFARAGYRLALADVDESSLADLAATFRAQGTVVSTHVVDVRSASNFDGWLEAILSEFRQVDVLVNNAGVTTWDLFSDMTQGDIDWVMDVNVRGVMNGCRAFIPALKEARRGHIVNLSSMIGMFPGPMQTTYTASKWAVLGFSQALRLELRRDKVGVTTVLPGVIATPFMAHARGQDPEHLSRLGELMKKYGSSPDRVASRVLSAVRWNRGQIRVGIDSHLVAFVQRFLPGLLPWVLGRIYPLLQGSRDKSGEQDS